MAWNPNQKFAMPMFNPWVPEGVRPWIYLLFALFFQLSGGVYFASLQQMVGELQAALHQSAVAHQCGLGHCRLQPAQPMAH